MECTVIVKQEVVPTYIENIEINLVYYQKKRKSFKRRRMLDKKIVQQNHTQKTIGKN